MLSESGDLRTTSMEHRSSYEDSLDGDADREAGPSEPGLLKSLTTTSGAHRVVTRPQSGSADESPSTGDDLTDSCTVNPTGSAKSGMYRSSTRKSVRGGGVSREREQELLQQLDDECKAHEATQKELEATEDALQAVTSAVNQAADDKLEAVLEVASIRKQLAQWTAGNSTGSLTMVTILHSISLHFLLCSVPPRNRPESSENLC